MKKAASLKVGDTAIYISNYEVKTSCVIPKPINDGKTRPIFKIGRIDLENGDYLIGGQSVFDTEDEAKKRLIDDITNEIKQHENTKFIAEGMIKLLNLKLEKINGR